MTESERLLAYVVLDHARRLEQYCADRKCENCIFFIGYCAFHEAPYSANLDEVERRVERILTGDKTGGYCND